MRLAKAESDSYYPGGRYARHWFDVGQFPLVGLRIRNKSSQLIRRRRIRPGPCDT